LNNKRILSPAKKKKPLNGNKFRIVH